MADSARSTYTRDEAATRAGLEPDYLARLIELGILTPTPDDRLTKGDIRRAQMVETLEQAGIGLEGLASGVKNGYLSLGFMDSPMYERFATLSDETFAQLSERTGLPVELLMVIREATGGAMPVPGDRVREDEFAVVPLIATQVAMGFRPRAIERGLRVIGESLRRSAETESDAWSTELMEPILSRGGKPADLTELSTSDKSLAMDRASDEALLAIWHAQQARSWTSNIIGGFEGALTGAGLLSKPQRPPAICFLDITGYTRLTGEHGDEAAASLAEGLARLVHRSSLERGGRPVKWLGDGVMVYFRDPGPGVLAALDMVDGVASAGLPPAHVGLHAGPVLFQEGDYFGQTVNLAARIADYARPGEVLVTSEVVELSTDAGATFTEIGPVELKGISEVVQLHAAHRR
jgi:class 3 adenylate cyclase